MPLSLITGSNGFAGSHLVEYLLSKGHRVRCLVRRTSDLTNLEGLEVDYVFGDVTSPESLPPSLTGIDYVFHFAGVTKARDEAGYFRVNGEGTGNLIRACLDVPGLKMLVYCSSLAALGPQREAEPLNEEMTPAPLTAYGRSKLRGEASLREIAGDRIPWVIIRPSGIYGPRDREILIYFKMIQRGLRLILNAPGRQVSLIHAQDLARLCWLAANSSSPGEVYLATDGEGYSWEGLSRLIEAALKRKAVSFRIPLGLATLAALATELWGRMKGVPVTLNREKIRELKAPGWFCSMDKAEKKLGFKPVHSIEEGIAETARWYRDNGWL